MVLLVATTANIILTKSDIVDDKDDIGSATADTQQLPKCGGPSCWHKIGPRKRRWGAIYLQHDKEMVF